MLKELYALSEKASGRRTPMAVAASDSDISKPEPVAKVEKVAS